MRQYEAAWNTLRDTKLLVLACHPSSVATVIQAIKKEKTRENAPRRALEIANFGKLQITKAAGEGKYAGKIVVTFKLLPPAEVFPNEL